MKNTESKSFPTIEDFARDQLVVFLTKKQTSCLDTILERAYQYFLMLAHINAAKEPRCGHNAKVYREWSRRTSELIDFGHTLLRIREKVPSREREKS